MRLGVQVRSYNISTSTQKLFEFYFQLYFLLNRKSLLNFVMCRVCTRQDIFISESVSLILKDKIWRFLTTRITNAYITCIGMLCRHILCLLHTVQVWSIVYLLSGHAKCLSLDKRTSPHFLFILISSQGMGRKQTIFYYEKITNRCRHVTITTLFLWVRYPKRE